MEETKGAAQGTSVSYDIKECPILSVTVYKDRAEVNRCLTLTHPTQGEVEIKISSLTQCADPESVRVKGMTACEILEVSHETVSAAAEAGSSAIADVKRKIEDLERKVKVIVQKTSRILKQRDLTQAYASSSMSSAGAAKEERSRLALEDAKAILQFHRAELEALDEAEMELNDSQTALKEELAKARAELRKLTSDATSSASPLTSYLITILTNITTSAPIMVHFSYVVRNATWTPSYDIRVSTIDNQLYLSYFAQVTQYSGEDWNECSLHLSTSNPAIGSEPPPLPSKTVQFESRHIMYNTKGFGGGGGSFKKSNRRSNTRNSVNFYDNHSDDDTEENALARHGSFDLLDGAPEAAVASAPPLPPPMPTALSGSGDAGSTTFHIQRSVTIAADSKPHKVTVATASYTPQLVHYAVPSVSASVYMQAKAQNTAPFPLLASDKVSVFLDGNFISTSSVRQTSAGEFFNVYLGVDPAVKVEYMPCRTLSRVKGLFGGTEEKKCFYSTLLHNTKQSPCRIIIAEVLPRAPDDKITVELVEPAPTSLSKPSADAAPIASPQDVAANLSAFDESGAAWPKDFVTLNKYTNNVVWLKTLTPGEKHEIKFIYRITWPQGQNIEVR